jgi:hypothetical protein
MKSLLKESARIDSSASAFHGLFPQPLHIAYRWDAKEALILPIKVRGVVISHAIGRAGRIEVFAQHQAAGLQEPQPLLELQGTQRRDGLEVVMEARDAHTQLAREQFNAQRLIEIVPESLDGSGDVGSVTACERQVKEPTTLISDQEAIDDFARNERQENPRLGRAIQEADKPHRGIQQIGI